MKSHASGMLPCAPWGSDMLAPALVGNKEQRGAHDCIQ